MIARIIIVIVSIILLSSIYFDYSFLRPSRYRWVLRLLWLLPAAAIYATADQARQRDYFPDDIEQLYRYLDLLFLLIIPFVLFCLCSFVGRLCKRRKAGNAVGIALALMGAAGYVYGKEVGFHKVEVNHVEIAFSDLPPAFDGYRIVQFSDLHVGTYTGSREAILQRAVDSINAQQADLIVFTGDLQNKQPGELEPHTRLLSTLKARDGIYSVLGNHDYSMYIDTDDDPTLAYTNLERLCELQEKMGWHVLMNYHRYIHRGQDSIVIAGMENDGEGRFPQKGEIQRTLWSVSRDQFIVMLEHDPTAWRRKILPQCHAQLTLSGHTHGGQLSLLGFSPAAFRYKEYDGLYQMGPRALYVSRGVGGVLPFRLGATGEIVVITLRKK
ncbi:MAG: metallophosphoesterase [Prevotella sp.]|nr:metallophosphoesterase [Prevotella sp.]